jgi:hypothetical protein
MKRLHNIYLGGLGILLCSLPLLFSPVISLSIVKGVSVSSTPTQTQAWDDSWHQMREKMRLGIMPSIPEDYQSLSDSQIIGSPGTIESINQGSVTVYQVMIDNTYEVYVADGHGQNATRLTSNSGDNGRPRLNYDATQIVFTSNRDGDYEIYRMNIDGSGLFKVTNNTSHEIRPDWSPDGSKIIFSSNVYGRYEILSVNPDGTGLTRLTNDTTGNKYDPAWSPDGSQIAYVEVTNAGAESIHLMNSDGTNPHQIITNSPGAPEPWEFVGNLVWSPDGSLLTFDFVPWDRYFSSIGAYNIVSGIWIGIYMADDPPYSRDFLNSGRSPDNQEMLYTEVTWTLSGSTYYLTSMRARTDCLAGYNMCDRYGWSGPAWSMIPDWEKNDWSAPTSWVLPMPEFSRNFYNVNWTGYDNGLAGIRGFNFQHKIDGDSSWTNILFASPTTINYLHRAGTAGDTRYYRVAAYDELHNTEQWPVDPEYDTNTTFFTWLISGQFFDNRGYPITDKTVEIIPSPLRLAGENTNQFKAWMSTVGDHILSIASPGYLSPPDMTLPLVMDLQQDYYMAPLDSLITNGTMEDETLAGWTVGGDMQVSTNTYEYFTGERSVQIGDDCGGFCLSEPELISEGWQNTSMVIDPQGGIHVLYKNSTMQMSYRFRSPEGIWAEPVLFEEYNQSGGGYFLKLVIDDAQTLHAIYYYSNSGGYPGPTGIHVVYRKKRIGEDWIKVYEVPANNSLFYSAAVSHSGSAFFLVRSPKDYDGLYFIEISPEGIAQTTLPIAPHPTLVLGTHIFVDKDDSLLVTWAEYGSKYYQQQRDAVGVWQPKIEIPASGAFEFSSRVSDNVFLFGILSFMYLPKGEGMTSTIPYPSSFASNYDAFAVGPSQEVIQVGLNIDNKISTLYPGRYWSEPKIITDRIDSILIDDTNKVSLIRLRTGTPSLTEFLSTKLATEESEAILSQVVTVPTDMNMPTLSFMTQIAGGYQTEGTNFKVVIIDGEDLTTVFSEDTNHLWEHHFIPMNDYLGKTITIQFILDQRIGDPITHVDLDDVSLGGWYTPQVYSASHADCLSEQIISLVGENFIEGLAIYLDDQLIPSENVTWLSSTNISFVIPTGIPMGRYLLKVVNPGGQASLLQELFPVGCEYVLPLIRK